MIDLGLIAQAKKAVSSKPRRHVTAAMLLAVVMQESSGVPYFIDTKPGSLFAANVAAAVVHKVRDGSGNVIKLIQTGLTEKEVRQWIQIPVDLDGYRVAPALAGRPAKFRFEYGYWKRLGHLEKEHRFRMACSWGLVQFMGPNIVGRWQGDGDPSNGGKAEDHDRYIQRFAADVPLQLLYGAGMFDDLLSDSQREHGGDPDDPKVISRNVNRAYRGYNSGDINSTDPDVVARAIAVEQSFRQIQKQLGASHV